GSGGGPGGVGRCATRGRRLPPRRRPSRALGAAGAETKAEARAPPDATPSRYQAAAEPREGGLKLATFPGRADASHGHHLRTHVDGTDARRAEQTPFISQVVDLQGFGIRTRDALSRVSPVNCFHLRNPGRLAWNNRTPVGCGVQPKRLVKARERLAG